MPKLKIFFSDFFDVKPEALKSYGAFNISLVNDLPLFIDPFLLSGYPHECSLISHRGKSSQ